MERMFLKLFVLLGVVFGLQIVVSEAQFSRYTQQLKPRVAATKDHRCSSLDRRTVMVEDTVTYMCSRPYPGVITIGWIPSPIGPICKGRYRFPTTRYFRVQTCCPGWSPDTYGRCTVSTQPKVPEIPAKTTKQSTVPLHPVAVLMRRMRDFAQKRKAMSPGFPQMPRAPVSPAATMMANLQRMKLQAIRQRMQQMANMPKQPQMQMPLRRQMTNMPVQFKKTTVTTPNMQVRRPAMLGQMRMPTSRPVIHTGMMRPRMMQPPRVMMMQRPPMMPNMMQARMMHMMPPAMRRMSLPTSAMMSSEGRQRRPSEIPVVGMPKMPFRDPKVTIQPGPNARMKWVGLVAELYVSLEWVGLVCRVICQSGVGGACLSCSMSVWSGWDLSAELYVSLEWVGLVCHVLCRSGVGGTCLLSCMSVWSGWGLLLSCMSVWSGRDLSVVLYVSLEWMGLVCHVLCRSGVGGACLSCSMSVWSGLDLSAVFYASLEWVGLVCHVLCQSRVGGTCLLSCMSVWSRCSLSAELYVSLE
ncbi:hypothetical protein ScPMuIL_012652 [Solemya velum]